ncbi:hypothetical protein SKAU_G00345080 [Synaphobranchus kaupii]|uniref:Ig-like domain-containing protein n=1 Tax=Synaphobranchus kaupii TaxID=118154 RepID=A0A9Q1EJE9_SYNKA|nr:hypothetical protein SKAU_G00345080 [Synaphobranchus kaupii]
MGVSVSSAQSNVLSSIVGNVVTFPTAVKETGFIFKAGGVIAKVVNHTCYITSDSYGARLQWGDSTGLFSITDLRKGDVGEYRVQDSHGGSKTYQLAVWDPVPRPQVSSRNKMKSTCSVQCSVENGREVTLSWHREGETLSHTSSPNLSTPLSLPLEIQEYSAPYSCVATNPVSNKTVLVKPEEHCFESVSKPHIETSAAGGSRRCTLQCSVQNGREVTLSWSTEGETLFHTSNPNLNTPLSLTLEIQESNFTYSCVATNPVSEERAAYHPSQVCEEHGIRSHDAVLYIMFVLRLVEFVLVTLGVGLLIRLYKVLTQHRQVHLS